MNEWTENDWRASIYIVSALIRQRQLAGVPIPAWMRHHQARCEKHLAQSRQENGLSGAELEHDDDDERIGAAAAAGILGCSKRHVQRHAADLEGRLIGGAWVFRRSVVEDFMHGRNRSA